MALAMLIKVCGLSTEETLRAAIDAGASHIGLVHFEPSPRHLSLERAAQLRSLVPARVKSVLLLVDMAEQEALAAIDAVQPDVVQAHGSETPEWLASIRAQSDVELWKALPVRSGADLDEVARFAQVADRVLLDAPPPPDSALPGGNGEGFDWILLHDRSDDRAFE